MQIEIRITNDCSEPKIIIETDKMTEELQTFIQRLPKEAAPMIAGFCDDMAELLETSQIIRIYANTGKIFVQTADGIYTLRLRLYELENRLDPKTFVRISNSEIINLKKVKGFDLSFSETICVTMNNGDVTYVSRRYVTKIKHVLGI